VPRPERPVDAAEGPVQLFAADLRSLRQQAGNPPYRQLAKEAHFSKATLSAAASGYRLPTWEVTGAYVQACGGDVEEWQRRWRAVRADLGLTDAAAELDAAVSPDADQRTSTQLPRRARRVFVAVGGVVLVGCLVAGLIWSNQRDPASSTPPSSTSPSSTGSVTETSARFVGGEEPVVDGADPKRSGCAFDQAVTTLDSIELNNSENHFLGVIELRHSPACRVAWGRFTPSEGMSYLKDPSVAIIARRPATGTNKPYETHFDGQAIFGNILLEDEGCIEVTVTIKALHGGAAATTNCLR